MKRLKLMWNSLIAKQKALFQENKWKYLLEVALYGFMLLFFFSLPAFSYQYRQLPIVFMIIICVFIFLWTCFYGKFFIDAMILAIIGFMICILISGALTGFVGINTTLFLLPMMFFVFYHFFREKKHLYLSLRIFGLGLLFFSIYFVLIYFRDIIQMDFTRLGSYFGNENVVGSYFSVAFAIFLYELLFRRKWWTIPCLLLFVGLGSLTGSKSFLLTILIALTVQISLLFGKKRWYITVIILLAGIGLFAGLLQLPMFATFKTRIVDLFKFLFTGDYMADESTANRYAMIWEGLYLFLKRPVFGWGIDGFARNSSFGMYSHNTLIDTLVNFGPIALILFEVPVMLCLGIFKKPKIAYFPVYASLLLIIIAGWFTGVQFSSKIYYIMLAFLCGVYHQEYHPREYLTLSFHGPVEDPVIEEVNEELPLTEELCPTKKYLFLAATMSGGGAERMVARIARGLAEKGYSVTVLLSFQGEQAYETGSSEVRSLAQTKEDYLKLSKWRRLKMIRHHIKEIQPDVIVPFLDHLCMYTILATLFSTYRQRIYVTIRNNPLKNWKTVLRMVRLCPKGCIVQNQGEMSVFSSKLQQKMLIIPNFIESESLDVEPSYRPQITNLLAVGRLTAQKNYRLLLQAFFECRHRDELTLTIFGAGEDDKMISAFISEHHLEQRILLGGFTANIAEEYQKADLYLLSSDFEGMPNTLMEALAFGRPCIATDCPFGPSDLITSHESGLLVPVGDVAAFAQAIDWMVEHPQEAQAMGLKGRQAIKEHYTIDQVLSLWEAI